MGGFGLIFLFSLMTFTQEPLFIAGTLCIAVFFATWLTRFPWGKTVGTPIWVILICALISNFGIIPSAMEGSPVYDGVFLYLAPLGIFIALLEVDLKSIKKAGFPLLMMFFLGSLATVIGVLVSWFLVNPAVQIGDLAPAIAGMFTGVEKSQGIDHISIPALASLLALGFLGITVSKVLVGWFPQVPEIIFLTTMALILAQFPSVQQLYGKQTIGFFMILIFLAVIGTLCDFGALAQTGEVAGTLLLFVGLLVLIHGLVIFGVGAMFKMDWDSSVWLDPR